MFCARLQCWQTGTCSLHQNNNEEKAALCRASDVGELCLMLTQQRSHLVSVLGTYAESHDSRLRDAERLRHQLLELQANKRDLDRNLEECSMNWQLEKTRAEQMEAKLYASQEMVGRLRYDLHLQQNLRERNEEKLTREMDNLARTVQALTSELRREREQHVHDREEWERASSSRIIEFTDVLEEAKQHDFELGRCEALLNSSEVMERTLREGQLMTRRMEEAIAAQARAEQQKQASEQEAREAWAQTARAKDDRLKALTAVKICEESLRQYEKPCTISLSADKLRGVQLFNDMMAWEGEGKGKALELFGGFLLEAMTHRRIEKKPWQDGGVDLILCNPSRPQEAALGAARIIIDPEDLAQEDVCGLAQCKQYTTHRVAVNVVRELVGSARIRYRECLALNVFYLLTTTYFTKDAREEAGLSWPIVRLIDRDELIALFDQHHDTMLRKLAQHNTAAQSEKRTRAARLLQCDVIVDSLGPEIEVSQQLSVPPPPKARNVEIQEPCLLPPDQVESQEEADLVKELQPDPVDALTSAFSCGLKFSSAKKSRRRWSVKESLALCQGVRRFGKEWAKLARVAGEPNSAIGLLRGREPGQLKDRWRTLTKDSDDVGQVELWLRSQHDSDDEQDTPF